MVRPRTVVVAILAAASVGGWWVGRLGRGTPYSVHDARVMQVLDGDTLDVRFGTGRDSRIERVRLLGVDTPETHHPTKPVGCFGPEASDFTTAALAGHVVDLETDVETRDKYGRLLAFVIVDGRRFNDVLLERGYARLLVIPPNGAHAREMLAEELDARRHSRGLWGACGPDD